MGSSQLEVCSRPGSYSDFAPPGGFVVTACLGRLVAILGEFIVLPMELPVHLKTAGFASRAFHIEDCRRGFCPAAFYYSSFRSPNLLNSRASGGKSSSISQINNRTIPIFSYFNCYICTARVRFCGELAQLARAFEWHSKGHRFDSGILHPIFVSKDSSVMPRK